jgi:tRNA-Thr(GGU) m(6)t(6)A37 methyltransferase TsaA
MQGGDRFLHLLAAKVCNFRGHLAYWTGQRQQLSRERAFAMSGTLTMRPVGRVRRTDTTITIEVDPEYADALLGLGDYSHIIVLYWFHQNDNHEGRTTLRVHPRGDRTNPLTGVFATHSPKRPNLIALTRCELLAVTGTTLTIAGLDAQDGSPVVDIKGFIPGEPDANQVRLPRWV